MKAKWNFFAIALVASMSLAVWSCGSDDSSVNFDEDDPELTSGNSNGGNSSGDPSSSSSGPKSGSGTSSSDTHYSAIKMEYSVSDSNGSIVDSRDSSVYATLRIGPYIWMSGNVSGNIYGIYNTCYNGDDKNCKEFGRLYVANSGNACPAKFRLPTRTEWKNAKSESRIALQYGGMCKKEGELECKGLESEAYYQVNDGSVYVDYGSESGLFKKSAEYNFYSVRCLALTHIVYRKSDLPECDSALAKVTSNFYVTSVDSSYYCSNSGWTTRSSSYRRSCSDVIDTSLTYAFGDSVFVCSRSEWRLATIDEIGKPCDATRQLQVVEFNGITYYCTDTTWKQMTYPSTELGICHQGALKKIALTDKGDKFICDTAGWRKTVMTDIIGVCDSTKRGKIDDYNGSKYYCDVSGWRSAKVDDVLGACDSSKYSKTGEFSGSTYICTYKNSWRALNEQEKMFGICTAGLKGTVRIDTSAKNIYVCSDSLMWNWMSVTTYLTQFPCSTSNKLDTIMVFGTGYKCTGSSWSKMSTLESTLGLCTESRLDEMQMLSSTYYSCKSKSTNNYDWYTTDQLELTLGVCPSKGKSFIKETETGGMYTCSGGFWKMTTISDILGACTSARGLVDTVYKGVEYVCDTSLCGARNPMWHKMEAIDSIIGYCNRDRVGQAVAFDDTVYVCVSVDVFSEFAYTQTAMLNDIFSARRQWSVAPDSIASAFRKEDLLNQIGECTSARIGATFKNDVLDMTCSSTGWHGKTTNFTDSRDGQVYKQATIGSQTWMAENLRYNPSTDSTWCYDGIAQNCTQQGRLYQWHTALGLPESKDSVKVFSTFNETEYSLDSLQRGICPAGWRIPLQSDWNKLSQYIFSLLPKPDAKNLRNSEVEYLSSKDFFGMNLQDVGYRRYWKQNGIDKMFEYLDHGSGYWQVKDQPPSEYSNPPEPARANVYAPVAGSPLSTMYKAYALPVRCIKE